MEQETPVPRGHKGEGEDGGRHQAPPPAHASPASDAEAEDPDSPRFPSSRLICPISHMVPLNPCHFMGGDQVFDKDALLWYINRPRPLFVAASIFRAGREDNSVLDPATGVWIDKAEALAGITPVSKEVRHKVMHNGPKGVYVWCDIDPVTKEPRHYWRLGMALFSSILKRLSAGKGYVACLGMLYKFMPTADPETVETFLRYVLWKWGLQIDSRKDGFDLAAKVAEIWVDASLDYIEFDYESDHYRLLEEHVVKMGTSIAAYNETGLLWFEVLDKDSGEMILLDIHTFARRPDFRDWFLAHSKGSANPRSYIGEQRCFECDDPAQFGYCKESGYETVPCCHLHLPRCTRENCNNWTTLGELCFVHTPCSRERCNFPVVGEGLCRGCRSTEEGREEARRVKMEAKAIEKHRAMEARKAVAAEAIAPELERRKADKHRAAEAAEAKWRKEKSDKQDAERKLRYEAAYPVYKKYRELRSKINLLRGPELYVLIKFVVPEEGKSSVHDGAWRVESPSHFTTVEAMKTRLASCDPAWTTYFDPGGLDEAASLAHDSEMEEGEACPKEKSDEQDAEGKARYKAACLVYEEYRERGSKIDNLVRGELYDLIKFVVPEEGKSSVHDGAWRVESPSHFTTVVAMKTRLASCDPAWTIYFDPHGFDASDGAGAGEPPAATGSAERSATATTALEEAIESAVRSAEGIVDPVCLQRAIDAGFTRGFVLEKAKIRLEIGSQGSD